MLYLFRNDNGLIEVEIKEDKDNLGWVYRDDIEFFIYESHESLIDFKSMRKIVESIVKAKGKMYSDEPKLHHIRRGENNSAYFYISETDLSNA